jgi:putative lipoprotein
MALTIACVAATGAARADEMSRMEPEGKWLAEDIRGGGVIDDVQTTLEIGADGRATGSGGCNRFAGSYSVNGATLAFGAIATTRMACPPAVMDQESKFFAALGEARGWRIDAATRKLTLVDAGGGDILRFSHLD